MKFLALVTIRVMWFRWFYLLKSRVVDVSEIVERIIDLGRSEMNFANRTLKLVKITQSPICFEIFDPLISRFSKLM